MSGHDYKEMQLPPGWYFLQTDRDVGTLYGANGRALQQCAEKEAEKVAWSIFEVTSPAGEWTNEDGKELLSMALIAVGSQGEDYVILAYCGPAIDWHAGEYGVQDLLHDAAGRPEEPGLWVWVGTMGSVRHDTPDGQEWDLVTETVRWRRPTDREAFAGAAGERVWDRDTLERKREVKR